MSAIRSHPWNHGDRQPPLAGEQGHKDIASLPCFARWSGCYVVSTSSMACLVPECWRMINVMLVPSCYHIGQPDRTHVYASLGISVRSVKGRFQFFSQQPIWTSPLTARGCKAKSNRLLGKAYSCRKSSIPEVSGRKQRNARLGRSYYFSMGALTMLPHSVQEPS